MNDALDNLKAVVGTNAWGRPAYQKALRGSQVDEDTLRDAAEKAVELGLPVFDTAQDYGLGAGQKLIGTLCPSQVVISAKYTPVSGKYEPGQVRRSLMKDLHDFRRDHVDVYWLHLPNALEENLKEMAELYQEGKARHIGVSNFNLDECRRGKEILEKEGVPLYGVQNHYSLISRDWERNGLTGWCHDNGIAFWAWAVLEEGMLMPPVKGEKKGFLRLILNGKRRRLYSLYRTMLTVGRKHHLTAAQVAMSYVSSKGFIPICGCRRPIQIEQLKMASDTVLDDNEIRDLEEAADRVDVKVLGADMFRFMVRK